MAGCDTSSRYSSTASRRLASAASSDSPWLATSSSRQRATYQPSSWCTAAVNVRTIRAPPMTRAALPIVLNNQAAWLASAGEHRLDGFGDGYAVGERIDGGHRVELEAVTVQAPPRPCGQANAGRPRRSRHATHQAWIA